MTSLVRVYQWMDGGTKQSNPFCNLSPLSFAIWYNISRYSAQATTLFVTLYKKQEQIRKNRSKREPRASRTPKNVQWGSIGSIGLKKRFFQKIKEVVNLLNQKYKKTWKNHSLIKYHGCFFKTSRRLWGNFG